MSHQWDAERGVLSKNKIRKGCIMCLCMYWRGHKMYIPLGEKQFWILGSRIQTRCCQKVHYGSLAAPYSAHLGESRVQKEKHRKFLLPKDCYFVKGVAR